ncbi:NucA/NucB deoxyribonuclease domain-containing protein [Lentzea sp. NPDC051838]|uniref:NucA/NucB deoxyribonuclease domain-containing protein n=1 Tax=Lentzea sp. NPDC051838 TaxID=3154849 RepID=UPI00342F5A15
MGTKSKGGLLLPVVAVVAAVAYFAPEAARDVVGNLLPSDPVIIGVEAEAVMVADGAGDRVRQCTAAQVVSQKKCGDLKVIIMDAAKMPYITRNIALAWGEGKDFILTRSSTPRDANYKAACGGFVKKYTDGSCDEFAFASTEQGGAGARTEEVPSREQDCQGGTIGSAYRWQQIKAGDDFLVVISNPTKVATKPYVGTDIAEDKTSCGI